MLTSSKLFHTASALAALASAATVQDFAGSEVSEDLISAADFTVFNFYDSSEDATRIRDVVQRAADLLEQRMESGEWENRDIQWISIDIEANPHLKLQDYDVMQMVYNGQIGMSKVIGFQYYDTKDMDEDTDFFSKVVNQLTGEWVSHAECEDIQSPRRLFFDEMIYFGPEEDLKTFADSVEIIAKYDRYIFDAQRVGFYWNDDPECRKRFNLEEGNWVVMFNGEYSEQPIGIEIDEDHKAKPDDLDRMITESIVKATPMWGKRAHKAVFQFEIPGIVYMLGETPAEANWRGALMSGIHKSIQVDNLDYIPIMHMLGHSDTEEIDGLDTMYEFNPEDLPNFYLIHPQTNTLTKFPEPLDEEIKFSPEVIFAWAEGAIARQKIPQTEEELKKTRKDDEMDDYERTDKIHKMVKDIENMKKNLDKEENKWRGVQAELVAKRKEEAEAQESADGEQGRDEL